MSTLQESLLDAMSVLAESSVKNAPGTLTIECTITEVVNPGLGEYKVNYLENTLLVYTSNSNIEFNVGDRVYVLVPDGDFSKQKIILGASNPSTIVYEPSDSNNYMQVSDNLFNLDKNEIELCTYKSSIDIIKNEGKFNIIFPEYLKKYNTFGFSVKFKTSIPIDQQVNGNYGLKLELPFYTLKGENKIEVSKIYTFNVDNISGNPYRLTEWSNQTMFIQIDKGLMYDESKQPQLTAFVEGFAQKEPAENDIFIKDINFSVYDELKEEHKVGYYLHISAERGNYFFNTKEETKKKLSLQLKSNGRDIKLSNVASSLEETYKCYWFKEDASVKHNSDYYSSVGGIGWKCLNERTNVNSNEDGSLSFNLITNQYTYEADISNVVTSARFKCVIVINKKSTNGAIIATTVSNIIKLENLESKFKIKIASVTGSNSYIKNIGEVNLVCNVSKEEDNTELKDIFTYEWNRYDKNGKYLDDNFYTVISNKNDNDEISQKIKFNTNLIDDANIFICSVYRNYVENSVSQIELLGTESILIDTNGTAAFNLSIQNGDVLYKYDTDGDSPLRENYDGPLESRVDMIKPLTYVIYKADGTELTDSEYNYCQTTWLIPVNSLITATGLNNEDNVKIEEDYYIYKGTGRFGLNYTLANTYNYKKTNNTVILKVKFGDIELTAETAIKILKEGDNGTNNSNYSAVIEHNGAIYGEYKNEVIQKFQVIYCAERGTYQGIDYEAGWYYHNLNYKTNNLPEIRLFESGFINDHALAVKVYRAGEEITENYQIEWSMFDKDKTNPCFKITASQDDKTKYKFGPDPDIIFNETDVFVNIIQVKITISNKDTNEFTELYAYYPIEIIRVDNFNYLKRVNIDETESLVIPSCINGFSSVLYASDGTNPKYNSAEPFACVDSFYDIKSSSFVSTEYDSYEWEVNSNLTKIKAVDNQATIKPCAKYNSSESKNYVKASLKYSQKNKEETEKEIEKETKNYTDNITLIKETKIEKENLEKFFKDVLKDKEELIKKLDDAKNFINKRANKLNALDEVEKSLNFIYNYSEELAKLIDVPKEENEKTRKEKIIEVRGYLREVKEDNFKIDEIDIDNIKKVITEKEKRNSLIKLSKDYNSKVTKFNKIDLPSKISFDNLMKLYKENILDKLNLLIYLKDYADLYKQFNGIYNKFIINSDQCCVTYSDILENIINQTYKLLSQYGDENGPKDFINDYYDNIILNYQNLANIASENIQKLKIYLIEVDTAIIYIRPIIMLYNRYELSDIVGWDGNKLYTGGEGQESSYLYAPRIGAGKKEEDDDSFTGVVIGNRNYDNKDQTGLFGYHHGISTIFLDAETGSATFGKSGKGQIIIEPGNDTAIIKSGNYDTKQGTGMQIDLTTPEIRFGSGNFMVTKEGYLTAKGGGSIGGWIINDTQLYSDVPSNSTAGKITLDSGVIYKTNENGEIIKEYTSGKIYSHNHNTLDSTTTGFYLSQDGLSIGSKFKVTSAEGSLTAKLGTIGGWIIGDETLQDENGKIILNKKGYIQGNFEEGKKGWKIDYNGNAYFNNLTANNSGTIGGWKIDGSSLKSTDGKLTLNASGSITGPNWSISSNGKATFEDVIITSKDSGNSSTIGGITILYGGGLQSSDFSAANNKGYKIEKDGKATFYNIDANGGTLGDLTLTGNLKLENNSGKIIFGDVNNYIYYQNNVIAIKANKISIQGSEEVKINNLVAQNGFKIVDEHGANSKILDYGTLTALLNLLT